MLINTHKLIGSTLIDSICTDKFNMISRKYFIWGNIKPDCLSRYKFKKHYQIESFDMITKKIDRLSSFTADEIRYIYKRRRFNQELGVICHFLCDFFCTPHCERWEFKSPEATKKHILYERELDKYSKNFKFENYSFNGFKIDDVDEFLLEFLDQYKIKNDYDNDLRYAYFVCYNIINFIMVSIEENSEVQSYAAVIA